MDELPDIARIAYLLSDAARARIVWTLIDGTTRPAGELAYAAQISAPSASAHLAKLVRGGLLHAEAHGRHRYFRLASADVASTIEGMASLAAGTRPRRPVAPAPPANESPQFLYARTCYGHLAGQIAVAALEGMLKRKWLISRGRDFTVGAVGEKELASLGVDVARARQPRRVFARACIDLTQRRPHLGGALGEALLDAYVTHGWVKRHRRSRLVSITPQGHQSFRRLFGIQAVGG
jgi:DNA-binding transcriptional ArsR family regulator